ncbi:MAG: hypothetical protein U0412_14070 [Nitrospira sp.]
MPTYGGGPVQRSHVLLDSDSAPSNVAFNERKGLIEMGGKKQARSFFNVGMAKKFMQTVLVADAGGIAARRSDVVARNLLPDQTHDQRFAREHVRYPGRVRSRHRGSARGVAGRITRAPRTAGASSARWSSATTAIGVDCSKLGKGGYSVPSIVEPEYLEIRRCTADFVLLVEKGTQWLVGGQALAPLQLHPADGQRAGLRGRPSARAPVA